jgi:hypothetical protein
VKGLLVSDSPQPERLDYRQSERLACEVFGVPGIMGQHGLAEIDGLATPSQWARFYLENQASMDPVFLATAIDAMLRRLIETEDRTDLDVVRQALRAAQNEPWACSEIDHHLVPYGELPGEAWVIELIKDTIDPQLIRRQIEPLRRPHGRTRQDNG